MPQFGDHLAAERQREMRQQRTQSANGKLFRDNVTDRWASSKAGSNRSTDRFNAQTWLLAAREAFARPHPGSQCIRAHSSALATHQGDRSSDCRWSNVSEGVCVGHARNGRAVCQSQTSNTKTTERANGAHFSRCRRSARGRKHTTIGKFIQQTVCHSYTFGTTDTFALCIHEQLRE